jgi:hypothetical protein
MIINVSNFQEAKRKEKKRKQYSCCNNMAIHCTIELLRWVMVPRRNASCLVGQDIIPLGGNGFFFDGIF